MNLAALNFIAFLGSKSRQLVTNFAVLMLSLFVLSACSATRNCDTKHPYRKAAQGPELVAPEGLTVPPADRGLVIPAVASQGAVGDCLLVPPRLGDSAAGQSNPSKTNPAASNAEPESGREQPGTDRDSIRSVILPGSLGK